MYASPDGQYHIDAAAVCLPGFWRLEEKFRMSLDTLHLEAKVPHYSTKLQKPMNRFFNNMSPEKPVLRNNVRIRSTKFTMYAPADTRSSSFNWTTVCIGPTEWAARTATK